MAARTVVIGAQCAHRHFGAEMRAADADIDHVGDGTAPDAVGKAGHAAAGFGDLGHDVLACDPDRATREVAQRGVQHRAVLSLVDGFACEHRGAADGDACGFGKFQECRTRGRGQGGLGIVKEHAIEAGRKGRGACGIAEQPCDVDVARRSGALFNR